MRLTTKLLGYLNRVFSVDPARFVAFSMTSTGVISWLVEDEVLSTVKNGVPDLSVDLSAHTLASLVAYIGAQPGYVVADYNVTRGGLSARALLDDAGTEGARLYGRSSLLWAYMDAVASELRLLTAQVKAAPDQTSATTAEGMWIDEIGSYFGVERVDGEVDAVYGPRVIAEVIRPLSNNLAIEDAIKTLTGVTVEVKNATKYGDAFPLFDGSITYGSPTVTAASAHRYNAGPRKSFGLFDISYASADADAVAARLSEITTLIDRTRAAGFHLRSIGPYLLSDDFTPLRNDDGGYILT